MTDIFDNPILCKKCDARMKKASIEKNGVVIRVMVCPKCNEKIVHPVDEHEYNRFIDLKNKEFRVKMRLVGNSYAVSIPKEILSFMNEQKRMADDMVRLCFEEMGRLSLNFNEGLNDTHSVQRKEIRLR
jgi:DNA-directed RNA polymerase subunit M/transcription elongation factor TFIIS